MSSENLNIGARLKEIRSRTGLNQQDFSETIGTSYRSYRAYENGQREVPTSVLLKLHDLMDENPTWILTGKRSALSEAEMQIMGEALFVGLEALPPQALSSNFRNASNFLKLMVKLSLKQGESLTPEDAQEIAKQDLAK